MKGHEMAFRNLTGDGGLVASEPSWQTLEKPDTNGFCGLTSFSLIRPTWDRECFSQDGFLAWNGETHMYVLQNSDVVGFVGVEPDDRGFHAGLNVAKSSVAFPPNTLFRLIQVKAPGEWEAPGGVRPQKKLLVVSATFCLLGSNSVSAEYSKVCASPTTLSYASRNKYVSGLSDVLDQPVLTMKEEWTRDMTWKDRFAKSHSVKEEWEYVMGPAGAGGVAAGTGDGGRDTDNTGKTPEKFLAEVNEHIQRQREQYAECRGSQSWLDPSHTFLTLDEVLAVRLYTGPGYQPINDFLRQLGRLEGVYRLGLARHAGLTFTATTRLLCRAIRKLAAVTAPHEVAEPLFRAVRGELPSAFWVLDSKGMVCATDGGFMSTSRNRETPMHYMSSEESNVLWELTPGRESDAAFHRGASVRMLSQFPAEDEVLFPPCTMLVVEPKTKPGSEFRLPSSGPSAQPLVQGSSFAERFGTMDRLSVVERSAKNRVGSTVHYMAITVKPYFI